MMSHPLSILIRDAISDDIAACLALDHSYNTDHVWQMRIENNVSEKHIYFSTERLPRPLEATYITDAERLAKALSPNYCFLVAVDKTESDVLGYLTMSYNPLREMAQIHDIVVSTPIRRRGIGYRLIKVARQWAQERHVRRIFLETQTQNYPSIQFAQALGFVYCGFNDHYFLNQDIAVFFYQALR